MIKKYLTCKTRLKNYNEGEETIVARLDGDGNNVMIREIDGIDTDTLSCKPNFYARNFLAGEIAERLHEYEQLGYSPEELKKKLDLYDERKRILNALYGRMNGKSLAQSAMYSYIMNDIKSASEAWTALSKTIKNVIFNDPATIVFWMDGTKTVVKAQNEEFDPEKGLAMAIAKKFFGNKGSYCNEIKKWTKKSGD